MQWHDFCLYVLTVHDNELCQIIFWPTDSQLNLHKRKKIQQTFLDINKTIILTNRNNCQYYKIFLLEFNMLSLILQLKYSYLSPFSSPKIIFFTIFSLFPKHSSYPLTYPPPTTYYFITPKTPHLTLFINISYSVLSLRALLTFL